MVLAFMECSILTSAKIARGNLTFDKFEQPWRRASSNEELGI